MRPNTIEVTRPGPRTVVDRAPVEKRRPGRVKELTADRVDSECGGGGRRPVPEECEERLQRGAVVAAVGFFVAYAGELHEMIR